MFGRKQIKVKEEKDEELMMLVYRVRDQMAAQRKLVATRQNHKSRYRQLYSIFSIVRRAPAKSRVKL